MEWIINNKEWIFSGAGVAFISLIIGLLWKNKSTTMKQRAGKDSINIQINGDYNGK